MTPEAPIYYCAACGRARLKHITLSNGKTRDCAGDIVSLSLLEWRDIVNRDNLVWQLTDAGRAALSQSPDNGE